MTVIDDVTTELDPDEARVEALIDRLLADAPPATTPEREFLGQQYDLGLAWVQFPVGSGGLGLSPKLNRNVMSRVARAGGPIGGTKNPIGYGMCGPAVVVHGTDENSI